MRAWRSSKVAAMVAVAVVVGVTLPAVAGAQPAPPTRPERPNADARLSPTLDALDDPQIQGLDDAAQADELSVAPDGPGSLMTDRQGVLVEILAEDTGSATQAAVQAAGATITFVAPGTITARVPIEALAAVADVPGVTYVAEILEPLVGDPDDGTADRSTPTDGAVTNAPACPGAITSEGDVQLNADDARATYGVDGSGITVGILSDSYDDLSGAAAGVTAGELPGPGNPCGFTTPVQVQSDLGGNGTDEGRGMAEIVHDLAPNATLRFATAFTGPDGFAQGIIDLQAAGADVIVDDVSYLNEPMFQDGVIAAAVSTVDAAGASYFSSAGNQNLTVGGQSVGSYEAGAFRPATCPAGVTAVAGYTNNCHDFDTGAGVDAGDGFTLVNGGALQISLGWDLPRYGVDTDLGIFIVDTTTGSVVANADAVNATSTRASEVVTFQNTTGATRTFDVVVSRDGTASNPTGTPRFKFALFTGSGLTAVEYDTTTGADVVGPTLLGHHASQDQMATAAVRFNTTTSPESFSSRGPAEQCWLPVVSGGPASGAMPCQSKTIDLAATDGAVNSFFGSFDGSNFRFFGTSAAAPHAAAVAALALDGFPCANGDDVEAAMVATAAPVGAFGVDDVGGGLVDALATLDSLSCVVAPAVTDVDPGQGLTTGGQTVTITGSGFTGTTAVTFGPTNAASFSVDSDTTITATTPARPAGLVHVKVTNPAGTSGTPNDTLFGFVVPSTQAPTVTSVYPNVGALEGGTIVEIKGTSFIDATAVSFGPTPAASFTIVNNSTIIATSPARPEGLVSIKITNSVGTSVGQPSAWYSFRAVTGPPPEVTNVSPKQGSNAGGATITITGTGFTGATAVRFGPTNAASFSVDSDTTITATTPARPNGIVNVTVVTNNGTSLPGSPAWYIYKTIP